MKNNFWQEITIALVLVIMLFLFINPFGFWMSSTIYMTVVFVWMVLFVIFAVFIFAEKTRDEREQYLLMSAERVGFIVGCLILVLGVVGQYIFMQTTDLLMVLALSCMILTKVGALIYGKIKH
jgi:hypothetical protein